MIEFADMGRAEDNICRPRSDPASRLGAEINAFRQWSKGQGWSTEIDSPNEGVPFGKAIEVLLQRGPMLLAICLNNGYYTRSAIHRLLYFASEFSDQVTVFFTDGPSVHNYIALGHTKAEALRKARKQRNRLQNACNEAIALIKQRREFAVFFIDWNEIYRREDFKSEYEKLDLLYSTNDAFRSDLVFETREVLASHPSISEEGLRYAVGYPLEELAFLLTYNKIAAETAHSPLQALDFAYVYHLRWPLLEKLVQGKYDGILRSNLGFAIVRIVNELNSLTHSRAAAE